MKIEFHTENFDFVMSGIDKKAIRTNDDMDRILEVIKLCEEIAGVHKTHSITGISETASLPLKGQEKSDDYNIRRRIPNEVDLSEYDIQKVLKEEAGIRCPNCGQSYVSILESNGDYILIRRNNNSFDPVIIMTEEETVHLLKPQEASATDYHDDIYNIPSDASLMDSDVNVYKDTLLLCPCCNKKMSFIDWNEAYKYPQEAGLEYDNPCVICGGETSLVIEEDSKCLKCEECGFIQKVD